MDPPVCAPGKTSVDLKTLGTFFSAHSSVEGSQAGCSASQLCPSHSSPGIFLEPQQEEKEAVLDLGRNGTVLLFMGDEEAFQESFWFYVVGTLPAGSGKHCSMVHRSLEYARRSPGPHGAME